MSNWYNAGTITTNGTDTVTGVNTEWLSAVQAPKAGDMFIIANYIYAVEQVVSDTEIRLDAAHPLSATGQAYRIARTLSGTTNARLASEVSATLQKAASRVTVSTSAPLDSQGEDGQLWVQV